MLRDGEPVRVRALGGGVSNVVLLVEGAGGRLVLKQSLRQLQVADTWLAKQERIVTEGHAIELLGSVVPGAVPRVVDLDPQEFTLTIEAAPAAWTSWKEALLAGLADTGVAARLGGLLARWQVATVGDARVRERFGDYEAFEQLRVDPYYRTAARRHPELAPAIERTIADMLARRRTLVHADFSPKNVLVGRRGAWIIDLECAHVGDPAFDVAFLLNHLLLKALHRPADREAYAACAEAFLRAYRSGAAAAVGDVTADVIAHLGCLLLARVDGKSPAEYLTEPERVRARELATSLIAAPPADPLAAWTS